MTAAVLQAAAPLFALCSVAAAFLYFRRIRATHRMLQRFDNSVPVPGGIRIVGGPERRIAEIMRRRYGWLAEQERASILWSPLRTRWWQWIRRRRRSNRVTCVTYVQQADFISSGRANEPLWLFCLTAPLLDFGILCRRAWQLIAIGLVFLLHKYGDALFERVVENTWWWQWLAG